MAAAAKCILVLLILGAASGTYADCGFSKTCNTIGLSGTTITASCKNKAGGYQGASIDTNQCFANSNGNLVCGSNYAASCSSITVGANNGMIYATCRTISGQSLGTSIEPSNCIANQNGVLACCTSKK